MSKRNFLNHLYVARNLLVHGGVTTNNRHLDPAALTQGLTSSG
jgi:hypothetical protein